MNDSYQDILNLPHHVSKRRPQQPLEKRAAQFSPFAALTGYDDAVSETARYTDSKAELGEEQLSHINAMLCSIREQKHPRIRIEYFRPDAQKQGGSYRTVTAIVQKVDAYQQQLLLSNGDPIPFCDIIDIGEAE